MHLPVGGAFLLLCHILTWADGWELGTSRDSWHVYEMRVLQGRWNDR